MGGNQWEAGIMGSMGGKQWEAMGSNGYSFEGGDQWVESNVKQCEAMATTLGVGINGWEAMGSKSGTTWRSKECPSRYYYYICM